MSVIPSTGNKPPSSGYRFNSMQEIRSHSSILYNERMAILFYLLDMESIDVNSSYSVEKMMRVKAILTQIYKNIRTLIRNNPTMRATLNLDTKEEGSYITDVALGTVERMVMFCESQGYTYRRIYIIIQELNKIETLLKDILQYYHYFIRPDFRQKPDIELATEKYKEIADKATVEELKALVGKNHLIDFESLGSKRVELNQQIEYEEDIDGDKGLDEDDDRDTDDYKQYMTKRKD